MLKFGTEAQKQLYVRAIADGPGDRRLRADRAAVRFRRHGHALRAPRSRPTAAYIINGKKSWITSGPVARYIVLFAMTDPDEGRAAASPPSWSTPPSAGFHRGKTEPKLGIRASATCEIEFTGLRAIAGRRPARQAKARASRSPWACSTPAASASPRRRRACRARPTRRPWPTSRSARPSAQPIGSFQMTQAKIADMKCRLDASHAADPARGLARSRRRRPRAAASAPRPRWPS